MTVPAWLTERLADSPPPLRERLASAIEELDPNVGLAAGLLEAACQTLDDIRARINEREAAFGLLVADGLLTLACEAAADSGPRTVADECREMGPGGELGRLAARWAGRS